MVDHNILVYSCNEYEKYSKVIIENYLYVFTYIKECLKCKKKLPKCWRHSYIFYKIEPDKKILVIIFTCCNTTKAILPSFLIGEKGIGSEKRSNILKDLSNTNMLQKEIAKKYQVSEATVTRIKQKYMVIRSDDVISEIIQEDYDYPTSSLKNENSFDLPTSRSIANYIYNLLEIYKTVRLKRVYGNKQTPLHLRQMSCLSYYKFQKNKIKIVVINNIE